MLSWPNSECTIDTNDFMKKILETKNRQTAERQGLLHEGEEVPYEKVVDLIRNPETFANRIDEPYTLNVEDGVTLSGRTIELEGGYFTNMYDLVFPGSDVNMRSDIFTTKRPLYPHRIFADEVNVSGTPIACINGSFFFLQDEQIDLSPVEIVYNLDVREGWVLGLPSANRPALIIKKSGRIEAVNLDASGLMLIGNKTVRWVGGESVAHQKSEISVVSGQGVLFNSACCTIRYDNGGDKTSLRRLIRQLNFSPRAEDVVDVVVKAGTDGMLRVIAVNNGGGTDFFVGNFIVQLHRDDARGINIGDVVLPQTVGCINLQDVHSAITTGPLVHHFLLKDDHEINLDSSLGSFPPFAPGVRYARSVMYEDVDGLVHMVVFDAVPLSKFMKGVTPKEVAKNIPENARWAVFLDGGQSSRITFRSGSDVDARGNRQYVRLHKTDKVTKESPIDVRFLWSARGRPLTTMIVLKKIPKK